MARNMSRSFKLRVMGLMLVANAVVAIGLNEYSFSKFTEFGMDYGAKRWVIDAFCLIAAVIGSGCALQKKSESLP